MTTQTRLHYDIDSDISVEMTTYGNLCYVSIYNDRNDKSVAFQATKDKIKGLADFFNQHLNLGEWNYTKPVIGLDKSGYPIVVDSWNKKENK